MPIRQSLLEKRLTECLNLLSMHVQAGMQVDENLTKSIHAVIQHPCVEPQFFSDNSDFIKETISLLLEYIEQIQRPHPLVKRGKASPAMVLAHRNGRLREYGVALVPATASVMACYNDQEELEYYTISKGTEHAKPKTTIA